jgi:UDP-MurNAc hydroxylase
MIEAMKENALNTDILLCGYTGAGPYPQTYFDIGDPQLPIEAEKKKRAFFERYAKLVSAMKPKLTIPFAGQYLLGGKLAGLNTYRGVADPTEILSIDKNAVVLADDRGEVSTADLCPTKIRVDPYTHDEVTKREREICNYPFDYERLISEAEIQQLPLKRLLAAAARKASEKSECNTDYYFAISLPGDDAVLINAKRGAELLVKFCKKSELASLPEPRSEIGIDPRYLFGLLTGVYHWNNAEVGSQYQTRRIPNQLNRTAQSFLNYLVI